MGRQNFENNSSKKNTRVSKRSKIIIGISALIMLVGSAYLLIRLATFAGVGVGFSLPFG